MVGEFANWGNIWSLANAIEADPVASSYTDMYGAHQYFGTSSFQSGHTKPLWQTEMSSFENFDPGIDNAINVAGWINDAPTTGNANAWHYWWLRGLNEDNEGLVGHLSDMFAMTKRLFVMGNYSKFVRPGWVRIGTSGYAAGIDTIAFKSAGTGEFAVVVTNRGSAATLTIGVSGATVQSRVTPYQTYDDGSGDFTLGAHGNLERRPPIDSIAGGSFTATVPHGVTTFVGVASTPREVMAPGAFSKTTPRNGATGQSTSLTSGSGAAPGTIDPDYCIGTTNTCVGWTGKAWGTSVGQATSVTLSWGAASGATNFEYCIDSTNDNACSAWTSTGTATNVFVGGLSAATWYYWHVRASNSGGTTYANGGTPAFWRFGTQFLSPLVTTNQISGITQISATLNGSVNPNGVTSYVTTATPAGACQVTCRFRATTTATVGPTSRSTGRRPASGGS